MEKVLWLEQRLAEVGDAEEEGAEEQQEELRPHWNTSMLQRPGTEKM